MDKFDGFEPIDYLRGIRDGNIVPTLENLQECLRIVLAKPSRDRIYDVVLKELEIKHPMPTTVLLATRIANALAVTSQEGQT
jgi:hypothetical protein